MSINEVRYLTECGSTNAYVKEHFEEFGPVGAVYTTNQTAGRGRLGRTWVNAEGRALYYTVAIREPLAQPATLPLLASLAVRDQEEALTLYPKMKVYAVAGNCDFGALEPLDGLAAFDQVVVFYTHGHMYGVKYDLDTLTDAAEAEESLTLEQAAQRALELTGEGYGPTAAAKAAAQGTPYSKSEVYKQMLALQAGETEE